MAGLFDKLNVLLRANVNEFLSSVTGERRGHDADSSGDLASLAREGKLPVNAFGADIDDQVRNLRSKINAALDHQDGLQQQLEQLDSNIAALDQRADTALRQGDEESARAAQTTIRNLGTQADTLRAELEDHRRVTSEFIERVNVLEAAVSDARHAQGITPSASSVTTAGRTPQTENHRETVQSAATSEPIKPETVKPATVKPVTVKPVTVKPVTVKITVRTDEDSVATTTSGTTPVVPAATSQPVVPTPVAPMSTTAVPVMSTPAVPTPIVPTPTAISSQPAAPGQALSDVLKNAQDRFDNYLDEQITQIDARRKSAVEAGDRAIAQIAELDAKNIDKAESSFNVIQDQVSKIAASDPLREANTPASTSSPTLPPTLPPKAPSVPPSVPSVKPPGAPTTNPKTASDDTDDLAGRRSRLSKPD